MGAEDALSVAECVLLSNATNVTLAWKYADRHTIDGLSLERIFLFSHCINPLQVYFLFYYFLKLHNHDFCRSKL